MSARRRFKGRFLKGLRETPDGSCEWLIWSHYHNCWHRNYDGHACGYTTDIAEAGLFTRKKALEYHDGDRNEPFHVSEKLSELHAAIRQHNEKLEKLTALARAA